ncbi:MAG: superoxide dismutase [Bacteroidales bacterium]|jgi:Fe-Mn family superoxide dismutase|nr:superoxide dismutase [Bacteroidales bacterium]
MTHQLPLLPYAKNALEPVISEKTIEIHYGKHHQTYVDNLNKLIVGTPFEDATLETIILKAEGGLFNNAAQVWNHTFFWNELTPNGKKLNPSSEFLKLINAQYGSFDDFKAKFNASATGLFGSGWVWLVKTPDGKLDIVNESNAGNPLRKGQKPLLTLDVWEHAYYLDYQNKRAAFAEAFWTIVNWEEVEKRYNESA